MRRINMRKNRIKGCNVSFGSTLRILRKKRNMPLNRLSELSGVQIATLSRMETDKMVGALKSYMNIARVLKMKLSELFVQLES
jgi:transcriptional regulator with XRE-family HTH domain